MGKTFKRRRISKNRRYKTRGKRLYGGRTRKRRMKNLFSKRVKINYFSKKQKRSRRFKKRTNRKMYGGTSRQGSTTPRPSRGRMRTGRSSARLQSRLNQSKLLDEYIKDQTKDKAAIITEQKLRMTQSRSRPQP